MMRKSDRRLCLIAALLAALLLCGCGAAPKAAERDLSALYGQIASAVELPEMVEVPENRRFNLFGIDPSDCEEACVYLCGDSVRADEIWLIKAVDDEAASRIEELAKSRLEQKAAEMENYLPEQYAIVRKAELLRDGVYVALFVSPEAAAMAKLFRGA